MSLVEFTFEFSDADVVDLRKRVGATRFAAPSSHTPWKGGADPAFLARLAHYWADELDWDSAIAEVNVVPQFLHQILGDADLHFARLGRASAPSRLPVVLLHGWPSSFLEMIPLAQLMAADREVIIPSLPGFLASELTAPPLTRRSMATRIHRLMVDLGHERYAIFGGDVGGLVAQWIAVDHPAQAVGLHLFHPPFPTEWEDLTPEEAAFLERDETYDETDGGYSSIMGTRPDTLSAALNDSPIGLAAWIADKWRDWSDCDGDLESRFSLRDVAVTASLYWLTDSVATSMRQYFDYDHNEPRPRIEVPVVVTLSSEPSMRGLPRSIAERACSDIVSWREVPRGGHFLAHEEPEMTASLLTDALAQFEASQCRS